MKTHFEHLLDIVPDLKDRYILDLGSGRGKFLVDLALRHVKSVGLELNQSYIDTSLDLARENNVSIEVSKGVGEKLSYPDNTFDFVNMAEVIEHVENPEKVIKEIFRVLKPNGLSYVSVPNRFSFRDQHYGLYFLNWMPRSWGQKYISVFSKKRPKDKNIGFQNISDMHYYTYNKAKKIFENAGFQAKDIREIKIRRKFKNVFIASIVIFIYKIFRFLFLDSSHFLLKK